MLGTSDKIQMMLTGTLKMVGGKNVCLGNEVQHSAQISYVERGDQVCFFGCVGLISQLIFQFYISSSSSPIPAKKAQQNCLLYQKWLLKIDQVFGRE